MFCGLTVQKLVIREKVFCIFSKSGATEEISLSMMQSLKAHCSKSLLMGFKIDSKLFSIHY